MRYLHCAILVAIYGLFFPLSTEAGPGNPNDPNVSKSTYILLQLTNNDTDDNYPVISGTNVAWRNLGDGNSDASVMLRNPTMYGQVHQKLGSHTNVKNTLDIENDVVVFVIDDDVHIFVDGITHNISANSSSQDVFPQIAYPFVIYESQNLGMQVFDGTNETHSDLPGKYLASRVTSYDKGNGEYGYYYVYVDGVEGDQDIWAYDLLSHEVTQVTNNNQKWGIKSKIEAKGDHVVWSAYYDDSAPTAADYEIYGYHLDVGPSSYTQISQNDYDDWAPKTNGQVTLWRQRETSKPDRLMIHQNGTASVFANPGISGAISENVIVWSEPVTGDALGEWGMQVQSDGVDYDFSSFAGQYGGILQVEISGKNMVWSEWDGNDNEIWAAFWGGSNAILTGLDLSLINLGGLQLTDADLRFTSLRSALIEGTDFRGADLTGATSLQYAIGQAVFSHRTILPAYFNAYDAGWTYVTPEPAAMLLALLGLALLPRRRRR